MSKPEQLGWYSLSRKGIPGVMLGMERVEGHRLDFPEFPLSSAGVDVVVAFEGSQRWEPAAEVKTPVLAVLDGGKATDLLGWLHTFSRETFPLSQYCRVLTLEDWRLATEELPRARGIDLTRWSSIVAGEMLGQGEHTGSIVGIPLSWAHGCLSFAMARTMLLYGEQNERATARVAERLVACERNPKFQGRRIEQFALQPVWALAASGERFDGCAPEEIAYAVIDAMDAEVGSELRSSQLIRSGSAEQRVIGFEQIAKIALGKVAAGGPHRRTGSALLAAAAFLAGNGSSHIGLLTSHARRCPEAYVWFGLFVGLAGPRAWDASWMRLAKGVQRLVGASHRLVDLPQADLSWVEHAWLTQLSEDPEIYATVPRLSPRLLAIELLPGVSCQFRISGAQTVDTGSRGGQADQGTSFTVPVAVHRALALAAELQTVLVEVAGKSAHSPRQAQLFAGAPVATSSKKRTPRPKSKI